MNELIIDTVREGYATSQVAKTMTVGELRELLEDFDDDAKIFLAFDNKYTYGGIRRGRIEERMVDDDE